MSTDRRRVNALASKLAEGTRMNRLPYDIMEVGLNSDGGLYMADRFCGDNSFYVALADEYIAALIIRMNKSAFMYVGATACYGKRTVDAHTIADVVEQSFKKVYANKRGRKPNVCFYVADGNTGEILRTVKP